MDWGYPLTGALFFIVCIVMPIVIVWSTVWKGFALWRAARNHHLAWYLAMLILNTAGILEIVYIFAFSRKNTASPS